MEPVPAQPRRGEASPPLPGVQSNFEQVLADLEYLRLLIALRLIDGAAQLAGFLRLYQAVPPPSKARRPASGIVCALPSCVGRISGGVLPSTASGTAAMPQHSRTAVGLRQQYRRTAIGGWSKELYRTVRT